MNKVFRIVWNDALAAWTVASELSRGHAKARATVSAAGAAVTLALATVSMPAAADCVATGAAIAIDTGNAARTSHASMSFFRLRICVFTSRVTSLECEKAGRFAPGGPPGLLDTRARLLVWHSL